MSDLPRGMVAFLFTDIEGSTRLWQRYPDAMPRVYARHDDILRRGVAERGGFVYKTIGDAFQVAFSRPISAITAAIEIQRLLLAENWAVIGLPEPMKVRMAVHAGTVEPQDDGDYRSPVLNVPGRLLSAGHGGQILLSDACRQLVELDLPADASLRDLGEHRIKDLGADHIFQVVAPSLPSAFPPLGPAAARAGRLPLPPTPVIGRTQDVTRLAERIVAGTDRLMTLIGPGGTGKTRLALAAASDVAGRFSDGAWFVDLAPVVDPDLVISSIARILDLPEEPGRTWDATVRDWLQARHVLLVLDNVEQVIASAPVIAALIDASPRLTVLVTSRVPLRLAGEQIIPVPPLALPDLGRIPPLAELTEIEAIALFVARARAVRPDFTITTDNAPAVAEICVRVDGLPLAIELAAARIRSLSPSALLALLSQRLRVLTGGARDAPTRQRTLRDTIAWSHALLDDETRRLFRRLAVFSDGCTFEAVAAVAGGGHDAVIVLDSLTALVDHSLLWQVDDDRGATRYRMLETIREYALEQLDASGERAAVQQAHAAFFLATVESGPGSQFDAQALALDVHEPSLDPHWLEAMTDEIGNVRAALTVLIEQNDVERGLALLNGLQRFWERGGFLAEGRSWFDRFLALTPRRPVDPSLVRARALSIAGTLAHLHSDLERAMSFHQSACALAEHVGDHRLAAISKTYLSVQARLIGDLDRAYRLNEEALAYFRATSDDAGVTESLINLAGALLDNGDWQRARPMFEECLERTRASGSRGGVAISLTNLAETLLYEDDYLAAQTYLEESLVLFRENRQLILAAYVLSLLGRTALSLGDTQGSIRWQTESLRIRAEADDRLGIAHCFERLAAVAAAQGRPHDADSLLSVAALLREQRGAPPSALERTDLAQTMSAVRAALGERAFLSTWNSARDLPLPTLVERGLAMAGESAEDLAQAKTG